MLTKFRPEADCFEYIFQNYMSAGLDTSQGEQVKVIDVQK